MISFKKYVGKGGYLYRENFSRLANMDLLEETILTCVWSPIVWKNNYALTENFEYSDFMVLDFDEHGDETMAEVNHSLQDHKRIVAPTKSHSYNEERYRLIIPWETRITDYKTYKYNIQLAHKRYPWADKSCIDGARFFYPSKFIFCCDRVSEYKWDVVAPPAQEIAKSFDFQERIIPAWALAFINRGLVYNGSRNMTVFTVMCELLGRNFSAAEVEEIVKRAPISWTGVSLKSILKSALKKKGH